MKQKSISRKEYCYVIHKNVEHYVINRPTERAPKVEYTDDIETARKFFDDDFEVLEIDKSKHDLIECETTHIKIDRQKRVKFKDE